MLTSVLALYKEKDTMLMEKVLEEMKNDNLVNVKGIVHGQLFDKLTVSIFVLKNNLDLIFEALIANDIEIFPYNEEYRKKIKQTAIRLHKQQQGFEELLREHDGRDEEGGRVIKSTTPSASKGITGRVLRPLDKNKVEIENKLKLFMNSFEKEARTVEDINNLVRKGNYHTIRYLIKSDPQKHSELKKKFIPAVINCVKRNLEAGLQRKVYIKSAIDRLKEIIADDEIREINREYLINLAANALITLCSQTDINELIDLINSSTTGKKVNVLAAVKLSELIFEKEENGKLNTELLVKAAEKVNVRYVLTSFDVTEPTFFEITRKRFVRLIDEINQYKKIHY